MKFDFPKHICFTCQRCGLCCGDTRDRVRLILLLRSEADHISKSTSIPSDNFVEYIHGNEPYEYLMKKTQYKQCYFLKNKLCSIYAIRPLICRFYPFQIKIKNDNYIFDYTSLCPGIGKGQYLKKNFFKILFKISKESIIENRSKD